MHYDPDSPRWKSEDDVVRTLRWKSEEFVVKTLILYKDTLINFGKVFYHSFKLLDLKMIVRVKCLRDIRLGQGLPHLPNYLDLVRFFVVFGIILFGLYNFVDG